MPLPANAALIRQAQLDARQSRRDVALTELRARKAEIKASQATMNARRNRLDVDEARTRHLRFESEALRLEPDRLRTVGARHMPEEAGRYFRAALEDIKEARRDFHSAHRHGRLSSSRARQFEALALERIRIGAELRHIHASEFDALELAEDVEDIQRVAEFYDFQSEIDAEETRQSERVTLESAHALVAIAEANPEDPPYLSPEQCEAHRRIIGVARELISTEWPMASFNLRSLDGRTIIEANDRHFRAGRTLARLARMNLDNLPYPQGGPGQARSYEELNSFISAMARPNINDLEPDNRQCVICQESYMLDGAMAGVPEGASLESLKVEIPVTLGCGHSLGSLCLLRWITPTQNDSCPFCRGKLT